MPGEFDRTKCVPDKRRRLTQILCEQDWRLTQTAYRAGAVQRQTQAKPELLEIFFSIKHFFDGYKGICYTGGRNIAATDIDTEKLQLRNDGLLREEGMKKTRQANLELLRIFAMVMVVTAHLVNHGNLIGAAQPGTASYYIVWILFGVSFVCINIYLLISSYFLVESRFSLWKLVKMVAQVFFYAFGITLLFWLFTDVPHELKYMVYSVLPVSSDFYWFVSMYVGMYVLAPLMNQLIRALTKRQLECAMALGFVLVSAWPNIFYFSSALNTAGGVSIAWFLVVYLFGAYLRLYYVPDQKAGKWFLRAAAAALLIPASRFAIEALLKTPLGKIGILEDLMWGYSVFFTYSSMLVTAAAVLLFIAFLNLKSPGGRIGAFINRTAGAAFGVYLIHDHYYIRESLWTQIDGAAWLGKWYLLPACIGTIAAVYAICTVIELIRQGIFYRFEHSVSIAGFFGRMDEKLRSIWNGASGADKNGALTENKRN